MESFFEESNVLPLMRKQMRILLYAWIYNGTPVITQAILWIGSQSSHQYYHSTMHFNYSGIRENHCELVMIWFK